jgi:DNA-binding transcriptional MerR regulator
MKKAPQETQLPITIPKLAVKELDQVEAMAPEFSMQELVEWVNSAVERFYPEANEGGDKRVSNSFTVRTLRHYQTHECLDTPDKDGRRAIYGFRHYLQALLIRKLLYLRCSPEDIRAALSGKSTAEYKTMLFSDLRITSVKQISSETCDDDVEPTPTTSSSETWTRISLGANAELHLKHSAKRLSPAARKELLQLIERELRKY